MKYIDLTHPFTANMPVYPGDPNPELKPCATITQSGFTDYQLTTGMHVGTHIDGPAHMLDGPRQLVDFPLDHFFGRGILLNAKNKLLDRHLFDKVSINKGDIVLIYTSWSEKWGREEYFSDYPEMIEDLAQMLVNYGVKMVGLDTPSPDSEPFKVHKLLFEHEILIIENLNNLSSLIGIENFEVIALPLKIVADSSLVRVVARTF